VAEIARARNAPVALVGGAIRDAWLSPDPTPGDLSGDLSGDLDFAVQGDAVSLARAVADALSGDVYVMDAGRGTARVLIKDDRRQTTDNRISSSISSSIVVRPSSLTMDFAVCQGAGWQDDLLARDFTVNAIALDLSDGQVLDPTGGLPDLERRVIRAVSDHAITDDPVRALRAVRLAFALSMTIEPDTLKMVRSVGPRITQPSAERVRDEFMEILNLPNAARALRKLDEVGLLTHITPEIEPMRTCGQSPPHRFTVLEHTFVVLEALDEVIGDWRLEIDSAMQQSLISDLQSPAVEGRTRLAVFRLAVLLHDCAKPFTRSVGDDGIVHFYGHEAASAELAAARARALRLSGDEVRRVRTIVVNHMRPNQMAREMASDQRPPTSRALYRFFRDTRDCAPELALFAIADCIGKRGDQTVSEDCAPSAQIAHLLIEKYYARFEKTVAPAPLLTGKDVLALGVEQGPRIGEILDAVREAQMAGEITTQDEARELAKQMTHDS
jgi:tRNA nucleotidyltransferase/poly(A) polymerase